MSRNVSSARAAGGPGPSLPPGQAPLGPTHRANNPRRVNKATLDTNGQWHHSSETTQPSRSSNNSSTRPNSRQGFRRLSSRHGISMGRRCVVSIDDKYSPHEVLVNLELLGPEIKAGMLMSITTPKSEPEKLPMPRKNSPSSIQYASSQKSANPQSAKSQSVDPTARTFVFVAKDMPRDIKARNSNVEILVVKRIADAFGMKKGSQVILNLVNEENPAVEASHVELSFKDQYLSRSDIWRLTVAELNQRTVYKGQSILFMGTIKAQVTAIFVNGQNVHSAYFTHNTKPIFRSESARYVLLIQMAREMWDFDSDGSGEIIFSKVVNGFLPALFKKWNLLKVQHLVSIILFARVEYDTGISSELVSTSSQRDYYTGFQTFGSRRPYKDFYRVVVSEMASGEWTKILYQLKREFNFFRRDISLFHQTSGKGFKQCGEASSAGEGIASNRVTAESSLAMHGNILEAISLASSQYTHDYIDRDLIRTGISLVILTPGPGVFEVDYDCLTRTTDPLVASGFGIDLICMTKLPLHSVPLFKYRNPHSMEQQQQQQQNHPSSSIPRIMRSRDSTPTQATPLIGSYQSVPGGSISPTKIHQILRQMDAGHSLNATDGWCYAIPQWLHVSYWTGGSDDDALLFQGTSMSVTADSEDANGDFVVRCRMYDLQMRSVLETNEIETSSILSDPYYPRASIESRQEIVRQKQRVPDGLHDHIHGLNKFPEWVAKNPEKSLWRQLQKYDDSRAKLPTQARAPTRHGRDADDNSRRYTNDFSGLFGTSFSDRRAVGLPSRRKMSLSGGIDRDKSDNEATATQIPSQQEPLADSISRLMPVSPMKPPRPTRQISLTSQGFSVNLAKPAVAEVHIETVSASSSSTKPDNSAASTPTRPGTKSTMTEPLLTPHNTLKSRQLRTRIFEVDSQNFPQTPSIPIINRHLQPPSDGTMSKSNSSSAAGSAKHMSHRLDSQQYDRDLKFSEAIRAEEAQFKAELRAEDVHRVYTSKLRAGGLPELPSTLSPGTAVVPWLTLVNPSNPDANSKINDTALYSRWQHTFPRTSGDMGSIMKWKSLCCPASVPLTTEYFPTKQQFDTEYQRHPYTIDQTPDDELVEEPRGREEFFRELISLRLSQGFQVVVGPAMAKAFGQKYLKIAGIFSRDQVLEDGTMVLLSLGNTIHQLSCVNGTEVEVNIFVRKLIDPTLQTPVPIYKPAVRTLLDTSYETINFDLAAPRMDRNWNTIDTYAAGYHDELTETFRFWRARFVLIPMESRHSVFPKAMKGVDSPEEIRIEGIKRLTQSWQKHRHIPPSERGFKTFGSRNRNEPNPLDIVYKTDDPSVVIAAELETLPLLEGLERRKGQLVTRQEQFSKSSFSISALADAIQQPVEKGGVRMQNRRWHLRLHYNCFIGSDMTTWLMDNFEDLHTREEAEALGKSLMVDDEDKSKDREGSLFVHVAKRHPFRDGNYFYQIISEHSNAQTPGWFNSSNTTRKRDVSIPSTPLSESMSRESPRAGLSRPASTVADENSTASGATTPTGPVMNGKKRPRVVLSKVMKYDVDHRKRSYRPERIDLHYDRLHNPDNCYHIRIDWMNVTAKLIEDAVEGWAREAAIYGLRLVEVPIKEACAISEINAFRRPYMIKLAVPPPNQQPMTYWDQYSFAPQATLLTAGRKNFYQHAILKKFDFVLDIEAASNFPSNVDVSYSWGRPDFRYTQYIHRSGVLLAQVTEDGHFLMLSNRLYMYSNRAVAARKKELRVGSAAEQGGNNTTGPGNGGARSISASGATRLDTSTGVHETAFVNSPLVKPLFWNPSAPTGKDADGNSSSGNGTNNNSSNNKGTASTKPGLIDPPEPIQDEFEAFCKTPAALEAFYRDTLESQQQAIPATPATLALSGSGTLGHGSRSASVAGAVASTGAPGFALAPPDTVPDANIPLLTLGLPSPSPAGRDEGPFEAAFGAGDGEG